MISPELVRRYPVFWCLNDAQQKALSMIADTVAYPKATAIFKEGEPATTLFLLQEGNVSLAMHTALGSEPGTPGKELFVGEINPGEMFGIPATLADATYNSTAYATSVCRVIQVDAEELHKVMSMDCSMGYCMMQQMLRMALERLRLTHIHLAAAQS